MELTTLCVIMQAAPISAATPAESSAQPGVNEPDAETPSNRRETSGNDVVKAEEPAEGGQQDPDSNPAVNASGSKRGQDTRMFNGNTWLYSLKKRGLKEASVLLQEEGVGGAAAGGGEGGGRSRSL